MDPRLLDYYNQESMYLRELAGEFAEAHPKIASRLGMRPMQAGEVADPYVERLFQSFSLVAARMRLELDADFPQLTQRMLEVVYPNYVAPTPSIAVSRLYPSRTEGNLAEGFTLARGTVFKSRRVDGENTVCQFRSSQDVTLYPLEIVAARLTGVPPDIPALDRYVPANVTVRGALRLRLRTTNGSAIGSLQGLDRLPVYLAGDVQVVSHLFELLHTGSVASVIGAQGAQGAFGAQSAVVTAVTSHAVVHEGLGEEHGLLPLVSSKFHGHNLLHEYFACADRFYFFTLTGLATGLRRIEGPEVEIVVLLDRLPGALANQVDAGCFALFCTPVINLFAKEIDRIEVGGHAHEFVMIPDRQAPSDYEVFSVNGLSGQLAGASAAIEFKPLYEALGNDAGHHDAYFSLRRERQLGSQTGRRRDVRTRHIDTQTFVSLTDRHEAPYRGKLRYLSASAWVTNRDLPLSLPRDGIDDLLLASSAPLQSVGLIRPPSMPRAPLAERDAAWRLIGQLKLDYLALDDSGRRQPGEGLRELLGLFLTSDDDAHRRQVESIVGVKTRAVTRKLPGNGLLAIGRGIECALCVDESGFHGTSPYLFGLILEHYLARHVSTVSFTQTELRSTQRGRIALWPVRAGTRGVL